MQEHTEHALASIEANIQVPSLEAVLPPLRRGLGLDDFGEVMMLAPFPQFPKLSRALPRMASAEVQVNWTGNHGLALLRQTCNFVRSAAYNFTRITGRPLDGASILDFGCGYGRIARLMYYFTNPDKLFGVDPWDRSIEICREDGLGSNFLQSDYLPKSLPLSTTNFDLIYAFSVFTHLSKRATLTALETCRRYVATNGMMVITIRPIEYWDADPHVSPDRIPQIKDEHRRGGFVFRPHDRAAVEGDITYGDTSMTLAWLEANGTGWRIAGVDQSLDDPYQRYVFLQPV